MVCYECENHFFFFFFVYSFLFFFFAVVLCCFPCIFRHHWLWRFWLEFISFNAVVFSQQHTTVTVYIQRESVNDRDLSVRKVKFLGKCNETSSSIRCKTVWYYWVNVKVYVLVHTLFFLSASSKNINPNRYCFIVVVFLEILTWHRIWSKTKSLSKWNRNIYTQWNTSTKIHMAEPLRVNLLGHQFDCSDCCCCCYYCWFYLTYFHVFLCDVDSSKDYIA